MKHLGATPQPARESVMPELGERMVYCDLHVRYPIRRGASMIGPMPLPMLKRIDGSLWTSF